jgi:superfamily II DNA or RNA helicase
MKLEAFLNKYGTKMGFLEQSFLKKIYYKDYGEKGLDLIEPEVNISRNDGSGRRWRIDFVIKTKKNKFAIETDGFNYHAPGRVSKKRFNELTEKGNELTKQGFIRINLTRDQIESEPNEAIFQLRRNINFDLELASLFLNWSKDNKPEPHNVQLKALEELEKTRQIYKRGLVALATGLGKTYLSIFDTLKLKSKKILYIVHQDHILKQAKNSFEKMMPERVKEMGFYTGKDKFDINAKSETINIIFSTIQTLTKEKNLIKFEKKKFDYIVMDESHHTAAPSYVKVMNYFEPKFFLGLTATPDRMDKKNILQYYENNMVFQMDQEEAIKQGYLSNLVYKGMIDNIDYSNISYNGFKYDVNDLNKNLIIDKRDKAIIKKFKELGGKKRTIAFCASIEHADHCEQIFNKAGYKTLSIHSKANQRNVSDESLIEKFDNEKYQIAFVVDMLNEGVDIPDIECILMLRPTESQTILKQQLGRGLRLSPSTEKRDLLVLDFIGNYRSSPQILESLGINVTELKKDREKGIYYYDNDGRYVEFDEKVVDIFKYFKSASTKEVNPELISNDWKNYGNYIKENSAKGKNLYWSVGKKNNHIEVHLFILERIYLNYSKFKTKVEIDKYIKETTKKKFPSKTMEGNRALFLSKLLGFINEENKLTNSGEKLINHYRNKKDKTVNNIISQQLEKFMFWNDLFSLTDRHSGKRNVDELFGIFPLFFIYQVIFKLSEFNYNDLYLTRFEINNFLIFATKHDDVEDVVNLIIKYRSYNEIYELEKFLKKNNRMDSRFYSILKYSEYFSFQSNKITIKDEKKNALFSNMKNFEKIINNSKFLLFDKKSSKDYKKILMSNKNLIDYFKIL